MAVFSKHPFEMWEFNIYLTKNRGGATILDQWRKLNAGEDIQSFEDFVKIYAFFRKAQSALGVRNMPHNSLRVSRVRAWDESLSLGGLGRG